MIHLINVDFIIDNNNFITLLEITAEWEIIIQLNRMLSFYYYHINEWKIANKAVAKLDDYVKANDPYKKKSYLPSETIKFGETPEHY